MSGKPVRTHLLLLVVLCVPLLVGGCTKTVEMKGARGAGKVQITVDAGKIRGDISTMLTGVNLSGTYDNDELWAGGKMASYLKEVKAGILRFPGGCETSSYHWENPMHFLTDVWDPNINPNEYFSKAWGKPTLRRALKPEVDANQFQTTGYMDTDEYIRQCRAIGAEPMIGVNIRSGKTYNRIADSIAEAARWVQYCKDRNYNVKYWYLDNEPFYAHYSEDAMTVEEYTGYIKRFVPAMKAVDSNIRIIVAWDGKISEPNYWADCEYLIEEAGKYIDIVDVHWYWAWGYCTWDLWLKDSPMIVRDWCGNCPGKKYLGPSYAEDIRRFHEKIKDVNGVSYDIKLAVLEWNIAPNNNFRFSRFQHALMQAEMLGQFIEGGLHMTTIWPLTWGRGDIPGIFRAILDQENHKPTPSFYVFKLYSNVLGQQLATSKTNQVYIRPVSALSQDGKRLWVYLLNKSADGQAVNASLDISGFTPAKAGAISLTAPDLSSDVGKLKKLEVRSDSQTGKWQTVLPPYSLTMLTFHKQN